MELFTFGVIAGCALMAFLYAHDLIIPDWRQRTESKMYSAGIREGRRQAKLQPDNWSNEMTFNDGKPYHGSSTVSDGKLVGTTDTDYFYFFCPRCQDRQILRILDYGSRVAEEAGGSRYPDEKPKQKRDFTLVFKLYCPHCELTDFVKISNTGWQDGRLRSPD